MYYFFLMKKLEEIFEGILWKTRLLVLFAVISSLLYALSLFIAGFYEFFVVITKTSIKDYETFQKKLLSSAISSIDMFLIGTFLLIFALGIYEIFISKIDQAHKDERSSKVLFIKNLDDLKEKLGRVVIMVLIVIFFKNALNMEYKVPLDLLYLSAGAVGISLALFLTKRKEMNQRT